MGRAIENVLLEAGGVPVDITGAGMAGDRVNMGSAARLLILLVTGAWAGGTSAVTLKQSQDAAGTGEKALGFTKKWEKTALTGTEWAEVAVAANTFDLDTANEIHAIEVSAEDVDDGFAYVSCEAASPGANADLLAMVYILDGGAYLPRAPENQPDPKV